MQSKTEVHDSALGRAKLIKAVAIKCFKEPERD